MKTPNTPTLDEEPVSELRAAVADKLCVSPDSWDSPLDDIMALFHSHIQVVIEDVIGKDEPDEHKKWDCPCGATHELYEDKDSRNELRAEQRQRAAKYLGKKEV